MLCKMDGLTPLSPLSFLRNICSFNGCLLFMQSCKDFAFVLLAEIRLHFFFLLFPIIVTHTPDSDAADLLYHKNVQLHYKFILSAK